MARRRISGDSKLRRQLRRWPETLRTEITTALVEGGEAIRAQIEADAPKDEGDLKEAVLARTSRDGLSVQVGYGKQAGFKRAWQRGGFKSLWQEFGTREHPAQPFIRPSFRANLAGILDRIDAAVKRALRRASEGSF
jgi:HK97 gp10 family phage protein